MAYVKEEPLPPKKLPPLKENNLSKTINSELDSRVESSMINILEG